MRYNYSHTENKTQWAVTLLTLFFFTNKNFSSLMPLPLCTSLLPKSFSARNYKGSISSNAHTKALFPQPRSTWTWYKLKLRAIALARNQWRNYLSPMNHN